jgi:competence transcription factor ComK
MNHRKIVAVMVMKETKAQVNASSRLALSFQKRNRMASSNRAYHARLLFE